MKKLIYLYWKEINILSLSYEDNQYIEVLDLNNLKQATLYGCPIQYILPENVEKTIVSETLPLIFSEFNFSNSRIDLLEAYNITENDSTFDKLYKIAQKDERLPHDNFWISTK